MARGGICRSAAQYLGACVAACIASPWSWYHQEIIRRRGRRLTPRELDICERIGVRHAESVRIMEVAHIPNPLRKYSHCFSGRVVGMLVSDVSGITLGQGIYVRNIHAGSDSLVAHELVHVRQYQEAGSVWRFMREYVRQCLAEGYFHAPLEVQARRESEQVLRQALRGKR